MARRVRKTGVERRSPFVCITVVRFIVVVVYIFLYIYIYIYIFYIYIYICIYIYIYILYSNSVGMLVTMEGPAHGLPVYL